MVHGRRSIAFTLIFIPNIRPPAVYGLTVDYRLFNPLPSFCHRIDNPSGLPSLIFVLTCLGKICITTHFYPCK